MKHLIYKITLPIYLWSIGQKSLDSYTENIIRWEIARGGITEEKLKEITEELRKTGI